MRLPYARASMLRLHCIILGLLPQRELQQARENRADGDPERDAQHFTRVQLRERQLTGRDGAMSSQSSTRATRQPFGRLQFSTG